MFDLKKFRFKKVALLLLMALSSVAYSNQSKEFENFLKEFEVDALKVVNSQVTPTGPLKKKLRPKTLQQWLKKVRFETVGIDLFTPNTANTDANVHKNIERNLWPHYQQKMLDQQRINAGVKYLAAHKKWFDLAQQKYGVPAEIIAAILSIETRMGKLLGKHRSLDALLSLAFAYPESAKKIQRQEFFRQEAIDLIALAMINQTDPFVYRGSFAGAIGVPQFMPSSMRRHAIDFDKDGQIDLQDSPADAIGSVARYLVSFGWKAQLPLFYAPLPKKLPLDLVRLYEVEGIESPTKTASDLVSLPIDLPADDRYAVISVPITEAQREYFVMGHNFFVVTRYNRSFRYALAVTLLAEEMAKAKNNIKVVMR